MIQTMTDNSVMPFGRYRGKKLIQVPAVYLLWLYEKGDINPELKNYIHENLQALKTEAGGKRIKT